MQKKYAIALAVLALLIGTALVWHGRTSLPASSNSSIPTPSPGFEVAHALQGQPTGITQPAATPTPALNAQQRNSIAMLNYLTVLTKKISASAASRMELDEAYTRLVNNIRPDAVDATTLDHLEKLWTRWNPTACPP